MKLYYTATSPFVRKVLVVAHELGLAERIETTFLRPAPTKPDAELSRLNPLSKIPALVLDDGEVLYDSHVICEYLDSLSRTKILPPAGPERWRTLRQEALCDGILEAAIVVFYERTQRPEELHWQPWLSGHTAKVEQGLDALAAEVSHFSDAVDLGQICAGITIGWLEFRNVVGDIRKTRPALAAWYERFVARPSMQATLPRA